jgi:hypothetical protein
LKAAVSVTRSLCVAALSLMVTACASSGFDLFGGNEPGASLASGESTNVHFFTSMPNFDTGVELQGGIRYALDFTILSNWIDGYIDENEAQQSLDERGFANSLMPWQWLGATRRSRQHRWFELMLYQPNCKRDSLHGITDLSVDEDSGSYNFVASCDGKLSLFVNDTRGFYINNAGYANISLSRLN